MKYLLIFLILIAFILWIERLYWKRRAHLLELRLQGQDRSESVKSLLDAWIDSRIESRLRKARERQ